MVLELEAFPGEGEFAPRTPDDLQVSADDEGLTREYQNYRAGSFAPAARRTDAKLRISIRRMGQIANRNR
jgi:hypothetical protein